MYNTILGPRKKHPNICFRRPMVLMDAGLIFMYVLCSVLLLVSTDEEDRQLCICRYLLAQLDIRSQEFRKTVVNKVDLHKVRF